MSFFELFFYWLLGKHSSKTSTISPIFRFTLSTGLHFFILSLKLNKYSLNHKSQNSLTNSLQQFQFLINFSRLLKLFISASADPFYQVNAEVQNLVSEFRKSTVLSGKFLKIPWEIYVISFKFTTDSISTMILFSSSSLNFLLLIQRLKWYFTNPIILS